ncbi:MAG: hypothetical protein Q9203_003189, partial [Teloschistes exilis]
PSNPPPPPPQPSSASPKHTRNDLPVFTSTSSILFGNSNSKSAAPTTAMQNMEDEPNTPAGSTGFAGGVDLPDNTAGSQAAGAHVREAEGDVFDVPVTPEQQ